MCLSYKRLPPQTNAQMDGALEYLKLIGSGPLDHALFEEASGVGVVVRSLHEPTWYNRVYLLPFTTTCLWTWIILYLWIVPHRSHLKRYLLLLHL